MLSITLHYYHRVILLRRERQAYYVFRQEVSVFKTMLITGKINITWQMEHVIVFMHISWSPIREGEGELLELDFIKGIRSHKIVGAPERESLTRSVEVREESLPSPSEALVQMEDVGFARIQEAGHVRLMERNHSGSGEPMQQSVCRLYICWQATVAGGQQGQQRGRRADLKSRKARSNWQ